MSSPRSPRAEPVHLTEALDSRETVLRIAAALPPIERAYAIARFSIIRTKLLALFDLLLPHEGRILDVGCGFGLFSSYLSLMAPERTIVGVDPNPKRIAVARDMAVRLGLRSAVFVEGTSDTAPLEGTFDAAFVLDVLHHVPEAQQRATLERLRDLLVPGGTLLIKDITGADPWRRRFTELLDRLMVGWNEPLHYRHHDDWAALLHEVGFRTRIARVPDVLPYPHIVIVARRKD